MKYAIYYLYIQLILSIPGIYCFAQNYSALPVKEHYDALKNIVANDDYFSQTFDCTDDIAQANYAFDIADRGDMVLKSLLRMFEVTGDKAYLIRFVNLTIAIQERRRDRCDPSIYHNIWTAFKARNGDNIGYHYIDGNIMAPMAEYVFFVNHNPQVYNTPIPSSLLIPNSIAVFPTFGSFSSWLGLRVRETIEFMLGNYWDDNRGMLRYSGDSESELNINMQANYAVAMLYIGLSDATNISSAELQKYRSKAVIISNKYMSTLVFYDFCKNQVYIEPVMNLYSDNSYWWYDKTWNIPIQPTFCCNLSGCVFEYLSYDSYTELIEDISHAISVLQFPLAAYFNYPGSTAFTTTDMIRWRNTFTKRIFSGYSGNAPTFNNNVLGGNDKIGGSWACAPNSCSNNCLKNCALAYMPFYRFDDDAGETPNVYNILMDFYKHDFQQQGLSPSFSCEGPSIQGNQYFGLSEVVSAQWDKECPNLTLYNRQVVYDQDFFAKGILTIDPEKDDDFHTPGDPSYADPVITLNDFTVESGVEANFVAGSRIVVKKGHIKQGAKSRGYIDQSLACGPGKTGNNNYNNNITIQDETPEIPDTLTLTATPNAKEETVNLNWSATALSAYDYFTVERSNHPLAPSLYKEGEDYSIVVTVHGKGNAGETLQYEEVDKDPLYGISYYRVKQTGESGDFRFSNIATVKLLPPLSFSVRPNPATDFVEITFGKIEKGTVYVLTPEYDARIFIFTASGQQVYEKVFNGTFYKYSIDVSAFSGGLYFVTLIANDQLYKGKFVKE